jgi:prepilin-type N-terminal cleavage/methylation domain-containing protein
MQVVDSLFSIQPMKTSFIKLPLKTHTVKAEGFTLLELLVVLGVIVVLIAIQLPVLAAGKSQSKIGMCANNVRQIALACQIYANDNSGRLPVMSGWSSWAWDLSPSAADGLLKSGAQTNTFYCPGTAPRFTDKDNWIASGGFSLWTYGGAGGFHIIGYALALSGSTSTLNPTNQNATMLPETITIGSGPVSAPAASERVLVADATISGNAILPGYAHPENNYTTINGGFFKQHVSPHLQGNIPVGGNLGFKDGHVAWRKFELMTPRTISVPNFWW